MNDKSTSFVPIGNKMIVVTTLNTVCTLAICDTTLPGVNDSINAANGVVILIITKIIVPIILNDK